MSDSYLNLSAYKFTPFEAGELPALRTRLLDVTQAQGLRGYEPAR